MKFFHDLIFTQYYELKQKGRPVEASKRTALIMVSVIFFLIALDALLIVYKIGIISSLNTPMSGRAAGKIFGLLIFGALYGLVYFLFGQKEKYQSIIDSYEKLSDEDQKQTFKKGMKNFGYVFGGLLFLLVVLMVF
ncbi:MAG: hypothetical protein GC181_12795 [Bacteroidetes bacterium]|nr:hypothetical protein [Bacteroidota bacterium]